MLNNSRIFALGVLLFPAMACFAQSSTLPSVTLEPGRSVTLRALAADADSYQWFRDGNAISGARSQEYVVSSAGRYNVITFNLGGCSSDPSEEVVVTMDNSISADISVVKNSEIRKVMNGEIFQYVLLVRNNGPATATNVKVSDALPETLRFVSTESQGGGTAVYDENSKTINWSIPSILNGNFLSLTINVRAQNAGKVINSATVSLDQTDPDPSNNTSTDTKEITGIKIPNVITPNGDGKNETFIIEHLEGYSETQLTIINRWGSTVYQKNGYMNEWNADGLVDGTYFYVLKVKSAALGWQEFKGYVTVIR